MFSRGLTSVPILEVCLVGFILCTAGCSGGSANTSEGTTTANPQPAISSISPTSSLVGSAAQTLTINGTNFLSSSAVTFAGASHGATFVNPGQITIQLTSADQAAAGTYAVVVSNPSPGGGASNSVNFTVNNPEPTLNSVSPSVVVGGSSDMPVSLVGSNFVTQSTIGLNGTGLATNFVSATQLTATLPAAAIATGSILRLTVTNPSPGGGTSAALNVIVTEALRAGVSGPLVESLPPSAALVGKPLQYQILVSSTSPSTLAFSLSTAPAGMTINPSSGLLQWTPASNQTGDQPVTVVAQDSAGQASQSFVLSVFSARPVASAIVSAANGGTITVNDSTSSINGLSISIPAGALASDTTIGISELSSTPTLGGTPRFLLKGFSIEPDGTQLSVPAQVTVPYSPSEFATTQGITLEDFLGVYFADVSTGTLQIQGTFAADKVNHALTGTIAHFSVWEATSLARLCPPHSSLEDPENCPNSYSAPDTLVLPPVVLVHGFQVGLPGSGPGSALGNEGTWGRLRFLLANLDSQDSRIPIDAWRFDWDSAYTPFEMSAANLAAALQCILNHSSAGCRVTGGSPTLVNLVAHSFGGILVRTYLEGQANRSYPPQTKTNVAYANHVNKVMTIGTPHSGIGASLSIGFANTCANAAALNKWLSITCFEATGGGAFMTGLNSMALPALNPSFSTQYDFIAGQRIECVFRVTCGPEMDDGLITTAGNELCGGLTGNKQFLTVCSTNLTPGQYVEEINPGLSADKGLCHNQRLIDFLICIGGANTAMAAVQVASHPLWNKICTFLGGSGCTTPPPITVSVSPLSVTLAPGGMQQFTQQVTGTTNTAVSWSQAGNCGTVDTNGLFTAGSVTCQGQVTATSQADTTKSASASVTVNPSTPPPITVSVLPSSATLAPGGMQQFTQQVTGTTNTAVSWSQTGNCGTVDANGLFTAGNVASICQGQVTATSQADTTKFGSASVTVNPSAPPPPSTPDRFAYLINFGCLGALSAQGCLYPYTIDPNTGALSQNGAPVLAGQGSVAAAAALRKFLYVGNGNTSDISVFSINAVTGALAPSAPNASGGLPWWIAAHPLGKFLYMANDTGATLDSYTIDPTTGALTRSGSVPACLNPLPQGFPGTSFAIDPLGTLLYIPQGCGFQNVLTFSINQTDGSLTLTSTAAGPLSPAGLALAPRSGQFAYVIDLDTGITIYSVNTTTGTLTQIAQVSLGFTPRGVTIDPSGKFLYVIGANNVSQYSINPDGSLQALGAILGLSNPASLTVERSGKFLYVVNGSDSSCNFGNAGSVQVFTIGSSGTLSGGSTVCGDVIPSQIVTTSPLQ